MKYINSEKLTAEIERRIESWAIRGKHSPAGQGRDTCDSRVTELSDLLSFIRSIQMEQPSLPTIKGWIARDNADRLGLYDQKPTRKTELGVFSGIVHSWVIGDTWIGRFSLDQTAKTLFPNLCWKNDPIEVELIIKPIQGQPEVNLEKEEFVGVAESPSKTFPRVNEFDCGGSYRH